MALPILMYHAVSSPQMPSGYTNGEDRQYEISAADLDNQLTWLESQGYQTVGLHQFSDGRWSEPGVMLTFDDGHVSHYELVSRLLKKHGMQGVFFITTGWLGKPNYLQPSQVLKLKHMGFDIGAHGHTHQLMGVLDRQEIVRELQSSKEILDALLGEEVYALAWPGGSYSKRAIQEAEALGFRLVFSSHLGFYRKTRPLDCLPRLPLTQGITPPQFRQLVRGQGYYRRRCIRAWVTGGLRRVLGPGVYGKMRGIFFRMAGFFGSR